MDIGRRRIKLHGWRPIRRRLRRRDKRASELLASVATQCGVPIEMLLARSRCRTEIAVARRLAMYLMHVALGRSIPSVARLFDRHWSTVMRACFAIEDMRDDEDFDLVVSDLETLAAATKDRHRVRQRRTRHVAG